MTRQIHKVGERRHTPWWNKLFQKLCSRRISTKPLDIGLAFFAALILALFSTWLYDGFSLSTGQTPQSPQCYRIDPSDSLRWVTGAWTEGGQSLLVVGQDKLLRVFQDGIVRRLPAEGSSDPINWSAVARIRNTGSAYFADNKDEGLISSFNDRLEPTDRVMAIRERAFASFDDSLPAHIELSELYDWVPLSSGILTFADFKIVTSSRNQGGRWASGFLYLDDTNQFRLYMHFSIDAPEIYQYTRNIDYLARLNEKSGYILFLDQKPWIGEVRIESRDIRKLEYFPEDFRQRLIPESNPEWHGARRATAFYAALEEARTIAGLYAWNDRLYLLVKEEMKANNLTPWWLIQLASRDGSEMARISLPTGAPHLSVIPGMEYWALIEKGEVQPFGDIGRPYMETKSIVLIPTEWIERPARSPALESLTPACLSRETITMG